MHDRTSAASSGAGAAGAPWLLLAQQLPTRPARVRMRVWRRMRHVGAVAAKSSVYMLPNTPQAREDFEWLREEIISARGQAGLFVAAASSAAEDQAIRSAFADARAQDYQAVRAAIEPHLRRARLAVGDRRHLEKTLRFAREEMARIDTIDFFRSPERQPVLELVNALQMRLRRPAPEVDAMKTKTSKLSKSRYRRRLWVTRPRPGIDRMASAWLIKKFIDPEARFVFAEVPPSGVGAQIPFDTYQAEFGHHGNHCTFETICGRFGIHDPALGRLAEIVHDLDIKDARYNPPESRTVAGLVEGLRRAYSDDHELLNHGMALMAGLFESFRPGAHGRIVRGRSRRSESAQR